MYCKILKFHYCGQIHSEDPTHEEQHLAYTIPQRQIVCPKSLLHFASQIRPWRFDVSILRHPPSTLKLNREAAWALL